MDPNIDDVLNYKILQIETLKGKIRFRIAPNYLKPEDKHPGKFSKTTNFEEEDIWEDFCEDADDVTIEEKNGQFIMKMSVPKMLHGSIIGIKGQVKRKVETQTSTTITVPPKTDSGNPIQIAGPTPTSLMKAKHRIEMILMDARFKQPFTHFISIPVYGEIKKNYLKFRQEVLNLGNMRGVEASIFQNPAKLHLTIGTLVLGGDTDVFKSSQLLMKFKTDVIDELIKNMGPLKIHVKGLEYMNDDPTEVDVLYARAEIVNDHNKLLQSISDELVEYFVEEGLMFKKYDSVKLHVTIMNTLFRKDHDGSKLNMENEYDKQFQTVRETFDAELIMRNFYDYDFGEFIFNEIHISIRKSTARDSGYYKPAYVQKLDE